MNNRYDIRAVDTIDKIVTMYNSGFSVKKLAGEFGCCRQVITDRLKSRGITQRNRSESMYLRMSQTDMEGRRKLVAGANNGMRNSTKEQRESRLKKSAVMKEKSLSKVGILEDFVMNALHDLSPVSQKAFGVYNIDIAVGTVAIEIHNASAYPHTHKPTRKRIINLLKSGWTVIYIKFGKDAIINEAAINKVRFIIDQSGTNPSISGKYWMVKGTGECPVSCCLNGDDLTIIETSIHLPNHAFVYAGKLVW
jgi:hypothetical protein